MNKQIMYFEVIKDENGEFTYGVSSKVMELTELEYKELKKMLILGIKTLQRMRKENLYEALNKVGENNE